MPDQDATQAEIAGLRAMLLPCDWDTPCAPGRKPWCARCIARAALDLAESLLQERDELKPRYDDLGSVRVWKPGKESKPPWKI